jgi:hypothetical protein
MAKLTQFRRSHQPRPRGRHHRRQSPVTARAREASRAARARVSTSSRTSAENTDASVARCVLGWESHQRYPPARRVTGSRGRPDERLHQRPASRAAARSLPWGSEHEIAVRLAYTRDLIEKGHADQILLSHDVCFRSHLRAYGGGGYDYLLADFLPRLQSAGVSAETIRGITVDNPRRALTGSK